MSKSHFHNLLHDLLSVLLANSSNHRHHQTAVRVVPVVGRITEQSPNEVVQSTPQFLRVLKAKTIARSLVMAFEMTITQQVNCVAQFKNKKGAPAKVDGIPVWSTDNTDLLALTPATDGLACLVKAVGPVGKGNVTVKGDADMGAGTVEVLGTLEINITGGAAETVVITPDAASEQ